jgi:hypothetical protein
LDAAITNHSPDTGLKTSTTITSQYDRVSVEAKQPVVNPSSSNGVGAWIERFPKVKNTPDGWTKSTIANKPEDFQKAGELPRPPFLITFQNPDTGSIAITHSYNKEEDLFRDENANLGKKAIRWSDMIMDNWRTTADTKVQDLKYIFRDNIQDPNDDVEITTKELIDDALKVVGKGGNDPNEAVATSFNKNTKGEEKNGYDILAGSDHVDRVLKMLADNHNELGGLNVVVITVVKQDGTYNLAIQLQR